MGCEICRAPKAGKTCEECDAEVCKNCVVHLAADRFAYHPDPPPILLKHTFCRDCHEREIAPIEAAYDEVQRRSEGITVVRKTFRGQLPCLKRASASTVVANAAAANLALRHLQFLAAWAGYDAVVDVEVIPTKVRNHAYETKRWDAVGWFANLDYRRYHPDRS